MPKQRPVSRKQSRYKVSTKSTKTTKRHSKPNPDRNKPETELLTQNPETLGSETSHPPPNSNRHTEGVLPGQTRGIQTGRGGRGGQGTAKRTAGPAPDQESAAAPTLSDAPPPPVSSPTTTDPNPDTTQNPPIVNPYLKDPPNTTSVLEKDKAPWEIKRPNTEISKSFEEVATLGSTTSPNLSPIQKTAEDSFTLLSGDEDEDNSDVAQAPNKDDDSDDSFWNADNPEYGAQLAEIEQQRVATDLPERLSTI